LFTILSPVKRLYPYWLLFLNLLLGLGTLFLHVARRASLPTRRRKGNLLSSLFIFFTGVIEQLIGFGESVIHSLPSLGTSFTQDETLKKSCAFTQRTLRRVALVATWVLFVLSFSEGSGSRTTTREKTATQQEVGEQSPAVHPSEQASRNLAWCQWFLLPSIISSTQGYGPPDEFHDHRWLTFCALRI
jgi:hypothetical protein